jgi:hypothetical protein
MDFLVGILGLIVGVGVCLMGLRLFFILLPIWGFVVGFFVGAAGVSAIFGDGFLATTLGIVIGLIVAVIFALISYLFWYFGVLLAAGTAGGVLGASLFAAIGVDSDWLLFIIGLIFAAVFVFGTLVLNLPVYLVIVNTAFAGSAIAIGGFLLLINEFDREDIGTGALWERINDNWFLWIVWLVGAGIGIAAQLMTMAQSALPPDKWTKAEPMPPASYAT